jgi:hypothetical protein
MARDSLNAPDPAGRRRPARVVDGRDGDIGAERGRNRLEGADDPGGGNHAPQAVGESGELLRGVVQKGVREGRRPSRSGRQFRPKDQSIVSPEWSSTPSLSVDTQTVPSAMIARPSTLSST